MINALEFMLLWLVAQAAVTDLALRRIPNVLVLAGLALALGLRLLAQPLLPALLGWGGGAVLGLLLFLPFYLLRGMAAGDVKLLAMVGAFAGPASLLQAALLACVAGGVLAWAMLQWSLWRGCAPGELPYAVPICVGTSAMIALAHL